VTDAGGREWSMLLKQWTANSSQAPRPIYVLERTSACMKAHRAAPGHILQAYILKDDPDKLRMTVISPSAAAAGAQKTPTPTAAAVGAAGHGEASPCETESPQKQQNHLQSNLDLLLAAASAYDGSSILTSPHAHAQAQDHHSPSSQQQQFNHPPPPLPPSQPNYNTIPRITSHPTFGASQLPPSPPQPTSAKSNFVLGMCQRSSDCSKESGHPGFCSNGYRPSTTQNMFITTTNTSNNIANATATNNTIDYFARHEDKRSPAAALNAAAQQMKQHQQHEQRHQGPEQHTTRLACHFPVITTSAALPTARYKYIDYINSTITNKKGAPLRNRMVNAPTIKNPWYTGQSAAAEVVGNGNDNGSRSRVVGTTMNQPYSGARTAPPPFSAVQSLSSSLQPQPQATINETHDPLINPTNPTNNTNPNKNNNFTNSTTNSEVCPTWIVIHYKGLRGDLHVPSMMVTLVSKRGAHVRGDTGPMGIRAFQLMAQTMHLETSNHMSRFSKQDFVNPRSDGGGGGGGAGGDRESDIVMVEGAGMSLQRWLHSWNLPLAPLFSSTTLHNADGGGGGGGGGGNGGGYVNDNAGGLPTPPPLFPGKRSVYQPYQPDTEQRAKRQDVQRINSTAAMAAAQAATELAISEGAAAAAANAAVVDVAASPSSMVDNESGSNESDIEAGEVLLSMMGVDGGRKRVRDQERERAELQKHQQQQHKSNQQQDVVPPSSVLSRPHAARVTPITAAQLYNMLLNEKIEAQSAVAGLPRLTSPSTAASTAIAMQVQLRREATSRAHARLDQLSKRAKVAKMLSLLSHINFPHQLRHQPI
jgi:hypothetical protein